MLDDGTARDLALLAGLAWDDHAEALAPLIDATIVWADEEQLDAIADRIVATLWADELPTTSSAPQKRTAGGRTVVERRGDRVARARGRAAPDER